MTAPLPKLANVESLPGFHWTNNPTDQSTVGNEGGHDVDRSAVRAPLILEEGGEAVEEARERGQCSPQKSPNSPPHLHMTAAIVPCPACGGTRVTYLNTGPSGLARPCNECGGEGGWLDTRKDS